MRRLVCAASVVTALALAAVFLFKPVSSPAEDPHAALPAAPAAKPAALALPTTRVTLYSSGVGYFQREGEVEGDARIDLSFPVQDVNDLLKSMVLQDLGGGTVTAASCDSHDPLDRTLGSFAVNLTGNPSFAELLHQARGEKVEVTLKKSPTPLSGTIIGVEPGLKDLLMGQAPPWGQKPAAPTCARGSSPVVTSYYQRVQNPPTDDDLAALRVLGSEPARLNLSCAEGLRSVPLPEVQGVRFVNPAMEREFRRALEVLAGAHDNQKRAVSLTFSGEGKRKVRVGYVVESPLWRTSYRLLVKGDGKLFLQGWAVVENPTSEDWKDVRLSLVSGRPISFKMDLYQPLYLPRPTVQPQLFAGLQPTTHDDPLSGAMAPVRPGCPPVTNTVLGRSPTGTPAVECAPQACVPGAAAPPPVNPVGVQGLGNVPIPPQAQQINLQASVASAANAAELGDFFEYAIKHPVSLPRQKSALLPIVSKAVEGSKVSIYNESIHAKFPLLALKMKNTSGLHLMQGPVAIFEGAGYAGDAHLLDLRPGEERLVSYAIDLGTEVESAATPGIGRLTSLQIQKGLLSATTKLREGRTYNVKNRTAHDRTVLIEHAVRAGYRLAGKVKPVERTREVYRFEVKVAAGKSASLGVVEERDLVEQVTLCACEEQALRHFLRAAAGSDTVKQALEKALELKGKLCQTQSELARRQGQLQEIAKDQARLRANLKEMPQSAAAYKRYLEKFDRQETEIERIQGQLRELQDVEVRQRQAYEAYWSKVEVGPTPAQTREDMPVLPRRPPVVETTAPPPPSAPPPPPFTPGPSYQP